MTTTIDDNGFQRDRYQDVRDGLSTSWLDYFPGRRTDEQSVNGRIISIQADLEDNTNGKIQTTLDAFSPYAARGNLLSRLAPLMAKRRRESVRSTVTLTVTADINGATIVAGSIVKQTVGSARFQTLVDVIVAPSSSASVAAQSVDEGSIEANAGSLDSIVTPVFGWVSVTNADAASIGRARESDGQLRFRMLKTSAAQVGTPEGIDTALSEVQGVDYSRVLENKEDVVNGIGMPPHSVFPIVDGGADLDIANALLRTVAAGIDYTDDTDVPAAYWTSVVVQNPASGQNVTVWFARPTNTNAAVVVTIETDSEFPSDGVARIKAAIIAFTNTVQVGSTLFASRLYTPVNTVPGIDINSLTIDATDRIVLSAFERIVLTDSDITVTIV